MPGPFVQEDRPAPGLPADDPPPPLIANPGARHGIRSSLEWLQATAGLAIARGGSSLTCFRLCNPNERVSGEPCDLLGRVDACMACEVSDLPPREGASVIGIDLGGSASMTAAAFYWPDTGRLETPGTGTRADRQALPTARLWRCGDPDMSDDESSVRYGAPPDYCKSKQPNGLPRCRIFTDYSKINGGPGAIRTPDPQIRSLMLYPAELRVHWSGF